MITDQQIVQFDSIALDCGVTLAPVDIAYESYGQLNAAKTNAISIPFCPPKTRPTKSSKSVSAVSKKAVLKVFPMGFSPNSLKR